MMTNEELTKLTEHRAAARALRSMARTLEARLKLFDANSCREPAALREEDRAYAEGMTDCIKLIKERASLHVKKARR